MDCIAPFVHYCTDNKKAILHIYRSVQREVFLTYLDRTAMYVVSQYVEAATSGLFVSAAQNEEKNLLIRYYKCTLVGALLDWLDAGMKYDLLAAAESICKLFAGSGKQAFLKCLEKLQVPDRYQSTWRCHKKPLSDLFFHRTYSDQLPEAVLP